MSSVLECFIFGLLWLIKGYNINNFTTNTTYTHRLKLESLQECVYKAGVKMGHMPNMVRVTAGGYWSCMYSCIHDTQLSSTDCLIGVINTYLLFIYTSFMY